MNKILFDGSKLSFDVAGGVVNYINNLKKYFIIHEANFQIETNLLVFKNKDRTTLKTKTIEELRSIKIAGYFKFFKIILFGMPKEYRLFHSPYMFLPPKKKNAINVLTVLDMINFERPFTIRNKLREVALRLAIKRADYYICISNATKNKLQTYFPSVRDDQIKVTYLGIEESFLSTSSSTEFNHLTQDPYLLYVGQRSDYKNFNSLIELMASSRLSEEIKILCVGGGKFNDHELSLLKTNNLNKIIVHVGYSDLEGLKHLYQNALALAYTSLEEGFGLPILEAMASGCPVICGNFSSMKEIAGGHAILVDDFSIQSLEKAVIHASAINKNEIAKAKSYAASFTWDKTAINTLSIYSQLISSLIKNP